MPKTPLIKKTTDIVSGDVFIWTGLLGQEQVSGMPTYKRIRILGISETGVLAATVGDYGGSFHVPISDALVMIDQGIWEFHDNPEPDLPSPCPFPKDPLA